MRDDLAMLLSSPAAAFSSRPCSPASGMHPPAKLLGPIIHSCGFSGRNVHIHHVTLNLRNDCAKTLARCTDISNKNPNPRRTGRVATRSIMLLNSNASRTRTHTVAFPPFVWRQMHPSRWKTKLSTN